MELHNHYDKLTQQIHYLINRNKTGIYHLGSNDLTHHEDFIKEMDTFPKSEDFKILTKEDTRKFGKKPVNLV